MFRLQHSHSLKCLCSITLHCCLFSFVTGVLYKKWKDILSCSRQRLWAPSYSRYLFNTPECLSLWDIFNSCLAWNCQKLAFSNWKPGGINRGNAPELLCIMLVLQLISIWLHMSALKLYEIWGFYYISYCGLLCDDAVVRLLVSSILNECNCLHCQGSLNSEEHKVVQSGMGMLERDAGFDITAQQ